MRFSIWPSALQPWSEVLATASYAEATGWDGTWIADHFMPNAGGAFPPETPTLEAGTLVAALAASVPRIRIGTLVLGNTYRHPAVVANIAATVDHVSGGRFTLGIGAGWQENEHAAYGIELPPAGARIDRLAEATEVIHGLLRTERTTFRGRYYEITDAVCEPKPVQEPLPILVGGGGDRALGVAARWADAWNTWGQPDRIAERSAALTRACERLGREPDLIARTAQALVFIADEGADADAVAKIENWSTGLPCRRSAERSSSSATWSRPTPRPVSTSSSSRTARSAMARRSSSGWIDSSTRWPPPSASAGRWC